MNQKRELEVDVTSDGVRAAVEEAERLAREAKPDESDIAMPTDREALRKSVEDS